MDEEARRFARRMLAPIVTEFKREVAQQRANGATEADIEAMLDRIESVNRPVMDADQLEYFMELFREAARALHQGLKTVPEIFKVSRKAYAAPRFLPWGFLQRGTESRRGVNSLRRRDEADPKGGNSPRGYEDLPQLLQVSLIPATQPSFRYVIASLGTIEHPKL
jgi:hypothetical protein